MTALGWLTLWCCGALPMAILETWHLVTGKPRLGIRVATMVIMVAFWPLWLTASVLCLPWSIPVMFRSRNR